MDALAPDKHAEPSGREDHGHSALSFIHRLLSANDGEPRTLGGLVADMARAFGAAGAGLSAPLEQPALPALIHLQQWVKPNRFEPVEYPWERRPQIVAQAKNTAAALALAEPRLSWLITPVWPTESGGWLLWLQDEP